MQQVGVGGTDVHRPQLKATIEQCVSRCRISNDRDSPPRPLSGPGRTLRRRQNLDLPRAAGTEPDFSSRSAPPRGRHAPARETARITISRPDGVRRLVTEAGCWNGRRFRRTYGTPRAPVEGALADGGTSCSTSTGRATQLRATLSRDVVGIFVYPPRSPNCRPG